MVQLKSAIRSEIDLNADGKHSGFLRLPHSVHRSAYGWLPIPIVSVKNGDGPVVLLMAGNHGDEYEGQIALCKLIRTLDPEELSGQIIILPMANFPAARAGLRTSPIDGGNLNRSFPGDPQGNPTEMIAHYIEEILLPDCNYLLDIHSGGSSLLYLPCAMMVRHPDQATHDRNIELINSLRFPKALIYEPGDMGYFSSSAARRKGVAAITMEVAGGGTIDRTALALLESGLYNYLGFIGVVNSEVGSAPDDETRLQEIGSDDYYSYANSPGLFEPMVELGAKVSQGQLAARIHDPETPWNEPSKIYFSLNGTVVCKRIPARVERGDCLYHLATPV